MDKLFICAPYRSAVLSLVPYVPLSIVIRRKRLSLPLCQSASERLRLLGEIRFLTAVRRYSVTRTFTP